MDLGFKNPSLRNYLSSVPVEEWTDRTDDQTVLLVLSGFDRFLIEDIKFDFDDADHQPNSEILCEIVDWLRSPDHRDLLQGYFERHCVGVRMNSLADRMWKWLKAVHRF